MVSDPIHISDDLALSCIIATQKDRTYSGGMNAPILPQEFAFFADESGISQDRFTVVGGICMHRSTADTAYDTILEYQNRFNMHSELKWTKISNQKFEEYRAFVDIFFALNNANKIHFHSIVFDSHQWDRRKLYFGNQDAGLSKLYHELILHNFVRTYGGSNSLFVCLDHRNSSISLDDMKGSLNAAARRDFSIETDPIKQMISRDSKSDDILQLNDVVLGAVSAARNGKHWLTSTRAAKRDIALHVLNKSGLENFERNSPPNVSRFTCWNFKLSW